MRTRGITTAIATLALLTGATGAQAQEQEQEQEQQPTIVDVLEERGDYTIFLQAVRAAGLEETLRGEGPITVFAPNDAAFEKLPEGQLDQLMADTEALRDLVSYHLVRQSIRTADVMETHDVETMQGSSLEVEKTEEGLRLNAPAPAGEVAGEVERPARLVATVVTPDVDSSNGVIHAIDTVLIAPAK